MQITDLLGLDQLFNVLETGLLTALAAALILAAALVHRRRSILTVFRTTRAAPRPRPRFLYYPLQAVALALAVIAVAVASEVGLWVAGAATVAAMFIASSTASMVYRLDLATVTSMVTLQPQGEFDTAWAQIRADFHQVRGVADARRLFVPAWQAIGFGTGHSVFAGTALVVLIAWSYVGFFTGVAIGASLLLPALSALAHHRYRTERDRIASA